jgi:hypothetical protein
MIDLREYSDLARESGAYTDIELDILNEALSVWNRTPGKPNILVELRDGKVLAGFAVMRREEVTEYTFNTQAICVGPSYLGTGAMASLLAKLEEAIRQQADSAILRVETSTQKAAAFGIDALKEAGYSLIGHIPDFYARGNDYFMYAKHLCIQKGEGGNSEAKGDQP